MTKKTAYSIQAPGAVVMVRPHHFTVNTETAADNSFQAMHDDGADLAAIAHAEITAAARTLQHHGVTVHLFEDEEKPHRIRCFLITGSPPMPVVTWPSIR